MGDMNMRIIILLAALLVAPGSAPAQGTGAPALTAEQVLPLCDKALVAAMQGSDGAAALADAIKDLPPAQQASIANICAVYLMGAVAAVKHEAEASAKAIKAGGTEI
jgi:hypothetical protein